MREPGLRPSVLKATFNSNSHAARAPGDLAESGVVGLTAFETEVIAVFVDLVTLLGLPKSVGEIYGLLFAAAQPLTFIEIEQKLALSKGSVSQGLRTLREVGAVREAEEPNVGPAHEDRKLPPRVARWLAVIELRKIIGSLLRDRLTPHLQSQDDHLQCAQRSLENAPAEWDEAKLRLFRTRLEKLQTWQTRARAVVPLLGKLL